MAEQDSGLRFAVAFHGGAGVISKERDPKDYIAALRRIVLNAYKYASGLPLVEDQAGSTDIVEYVVTLLENERLFNAGIGAVLNREGLHELESSIMEGSSKSCGANMLLKTVKNPISLARKVMTDTPHLCLGGVGAEAFAASCGIVPVENSYFRTAKRVAQLVRAQETNSVANDHDLDQDDEEEEEELDEHGDNVNEKDMGTGTVGCVAMHNRHVAAATSTGGMTNKYAGRVGDTCMIGAGTYANDETCAVSCTGKGEEFIRHVAAYDISARIEFGGRTLDEACRETVHDRLPVGSGGVIAVNKAGECSMPYNSVGMFRGYCDSSGKCYIGIWDDNMEVKIPDI